MNRLRSPAPLYPADALIRRLAKLNLRDINDNQIGLDLHRCTNTEVVWLSWWPRELIENLNQQLDVDFRMLPLENRPGASKQHSLRVELLRADRERVVWLDDDEAIIDDSLADLTDLLVLQPDSSVGLIPLYLDAVVAYFDGAEEARLIDGLVRAESSRWNERVTPKHDFSRRTPTRFDNRGTLMRRAFLDELAGIAQRAQVKPRPDESYGSRDGVRLDPWQLEDAVRIWAEHGLAIEVRALSGKPGEIQVVVPRWGGEDDGE